MTEPYKFIVGEKHPALPATVSEGITFSAGASGLDLLAIVDSPSKSEIKAWQKGRLRLALLEANENTLFVLYELHGFCSWSDAPFSLYLHPPERRTLETRAPHQGRFLNICLVEHRTNVVRALRLVSVSPTWCAQLEAMLQNQADALDRCSPAILDAGIQSAYSRWPEVSDMVRSATIIETAGRQEPFQTN